MINMNLTNKLIDDIEFIHEIDLIDAVKRMAMEQIHVAIDTIHSSVKNKC